MQTYFPKLRTDITQCPSKLVEKPCALTGVTVGYDSLYGDDMTTGMYTIDKDGIVGRSRFTTAVKTATLTVPHGTPYTGVAKLSGIPTTLSTTGNVTLKGYAAPAGN